MIPCPYHRYYYMTDRLLKEEKEAAKTIGTRAEQVKKIEASLFEKYKDKNLNVKPPELEKRGGAYYSDAAVSLISSIYNDKKDIHTINVKNNGTIKGIPDDSVVEVNCLVDNRGATPLSLTRPVEEKILGLIHSVKFYEISTIEAGVHGNINQAIMALANNPLVPSVDIAIKLFEDLCSLNKGYLPQFNK